MVTNSLSPSSEGDEAAVTDGGLKNLKRKPNPARIARIQAYARVQEAFRLDRKRCAGMVLEGKWGQETTTLDLEEQEAFWGPLFEASSKSDERPVFKIQKDWSIVDSVSISMGELARVLHDSEESAPGSDMITL